MNGAPFSLSVPVGVSLQFNLICTSDVDKYCRKQSNKKQGKEKENIEEARMLLLI